jgi:hypothetical protein
LCVLYKKPCISLWEKVHSTSGTTIRLGLKYFIKSTTRIQKQQKVNQLGPGPIGSSGLGRGPTSSNKSGPGPKNLGPDEL